MNQFVQSSILLLTLAACSDVEGDGHGHHHHEHEVITSVGLTFVSQDDGSEVTFTWADPEDDGDPVIDDIVLTNGVDYDVAVTFSNDLEDPPEDVTPEIADEADEHQIFFTGSAVDGPATSANDDAIVEHTYADADAGGLPIGLDNAIATLATGSGELKVTMRHMPPENGEPVKTAGMAEAVASGGFGAIGGANDIAITFDITVQ